MATETTTTLSDLAKTYYVMRFLARLHAAYLYGKFGDPANVVELPQGKGLLAEWRRWSALSPATTALTQGVTPAGSNHAVTLVTATPAQYGDFTTYSDVLDWVNIDPTVTSMVDVFVEQAAETVDQLDRAVLTAGTNVQYAGAVANRASVAASNKLSIAEIKKAVRTLKLANVPKIPDEFGGSYIMVMSPNAGYDIMADSEFILTSQYNGGTALYNGELGRYMGVRMLESSNAKVFTGAGASGIDVHASIVFGQHWFGFAKWIDQSGGQKMDAMGNMVEFFLKPLGSSGTADPLNQRGTCGWKLSHICKILNQNCGLRIEHAVS